MKREDLPLVTPEQFRKLKPCWLLTEDGRARYERVAACSRDGKDDAMRHAGKAESRPMLAHRNGSKDCVQGQDSRSGRESQCLARL